MSPFFMDVWMEIAAQNQMLRARRIAETMPEFKPSNDNALQVQDAKNDKQA